MSKALRCIFMGTPEIAVPAMRRLAQHAELIRVVTQPDRQAGRGKKIKAPPIKVAAEEMGIPVWQPATLRGMAKAPELQGADLFVVMAYGEILRQSILDLPCLACINLHASLLPRWRGASPLQACIRAGDNETGVSVMSMVRALDAGPVFNQLRLPMNEQIHLSELHDQLALSAADALEHYLSHRSELVAQVQNEETVTYCGKLTSEDGHLQFMQHSALEIDRWVRAYTPAPGCWVMADGMRLGIQELKIAEIEMSLDAGTVAVEGKRVYVGCQFGCVELVRIQAPGKNPVLVADYLNGRRLPTVFS